MNYPQIMSPPVPFASKSGWVMSPQLLWERRPCTDKQVDTIKRDESNEGIQEQAVTHEVLYSLLS